MLLYLAPESMELPEMGEGRAVAHLIFGQKITMEEAQEMSAELIRLAMAAQKESQ
jgi:hypothetical protein